MNGRKRRFTTAVALLALSAGAAYAADQLVLGKLYLSKNPPSGKRKVLCFAKESTTDNTVVGDPTTTGATLEIVSHGTTGSDQTLTLPSSGWKPIGTIGFKYTDKSGTNGPVKLAFIKKTPSGIFQVKGLILGTSTTPPPGLSVVPPNTGTDATCALTIGAGDRYCVGFGTGHGGGTIHPNDSKTFKVKDPSTQGSCPGAVSTTTSTSVSTTSTTSSTVGSPSGAFMDTSSAVL